MDEIFEESFENLTPHYFDLPEPTPEQLEAERLEQERQNQIGAARVILAQTDYQILKACEQLLLNQSALQAGSLRGAASTNGTQATVSDEVTNLIALRQEQRAIINELEN